MRQTTALRLAMILVVATSLTATARDVIPPRDARDTSMARVAGNAIFDATPAIDREAVAEVGRVAFEDPVSESSRAPRLLRDGIVRRLEEPLSLALHEGGAVSASVATIATGKVIVEGAEAVRLRFENLPAGTVLWIGGNEGELIRFEAGPGAEWGPTTNGDTVFIAAENYDGVLRVTELASVATLAAQNSACMRDVACTDEQIYPDIEQASRAIAYIHFVRDGQSYVCTGGLLNDAAGSGTPYLLTARHCISTPEQAASVEIIWDLKSNACGSNRMATIARSYGAELLVASETTDVALLKLASVPADRMFLGVDTRELEPGQRIHRVSHASGLSQTYSTAAVDGDGGSSCLRAPREHFIYSDPVDGAIAPGSSGAPLLLPGLYVAGQLLGLCGADPTNPCATFNSVVDGKMRDSWPLLAPYLDPSPVGTRRRAVR